MNTESASVCPECGKPLPAGSHHQLCLACVMAQALASRTEFGNGKPYASIPLIPPEEMAAKFPQFEVAEFLGRGGMGVVYKARQKSLDRWVAIKILPPERVGEKAFADRFAREAAVLAKLGHPNIVTVHDFGEADGLFYIVMEYVDGVNLRDLLREGRLAPEQALAIVPPVCDALCYAHDHGIVHRDIKPENILLDREGRVKVADFGIAKILGANGDAASVGNASPANATQSVVGTPNYSAPEQKSDPQRVDSRADIYSLGVVFYEMLTGELPGKSLEPPSRKVQIDVRLDEIVLRALERKPELRFQQASVFKTQVETVAAQLGGATSAPDLSSSPSNHPPIRLDLNRRRWEVVIWGFVLAAICVDIGMNIPMVEYRRLIAVWGLGLFLVSAPLALFGRNNLARIKMASQIVLVDAILVALAGVWCAEQSAALTHAWVTAIAAACVAGIVYCVLQLVKWDRIETPASRSLGYAALFAALMSSVIPTIFYWLKPWAAPWLSEAGLQFMIWLTLMAAIVAILFGLIARKARLGSQAAAWGGISLAIWLMFFVAGKMSESGNAAPGKPELFQDETLHLQPDGPISFRLKTSASNRSGSTIDRDQFRMSDFVHVDKITDENGESVRVDRTSENPSMVQYHIALNSPVRPGGTLTTVLEGTMDGLIRKTHEPDIYEYQMDHFPGYDGVTHRIERHELPPNAQVLWKNTEDLQEKKVGDHTELFIDRHIPIHGHIEVHYRFKLLPKE